MKNYILISHDVFFIADRLKEIDEGYFVVYSIKNHRFEVHNITQKNNTFCFVVPFETLDERTLDYCRKTRRENIEKIVAEIEEHNKKLEKDNLQFAKNKLMEVLT